MLFSKCVEQGLEVKSTSATCFTPNLPKGPVNLAKSSTKQKLLGVDKTCPANRLPDGEDKEKVPEIKSSEGRRNSHQWQVVKLKRKRETVMGKKKVDGGFRGVKRMASLQVGRCDKTVQPEKLKKYISDEKKISVSSCSVISNDSSDVKSFKIVVDVDSHNVQLNPAVWPENVVVRKFFYRHNNGNAGH